MPHVNKKPLARERIFVQTLSTLTVFSLYFEIRAKKICAAKLLAVLLHIFFPRDQNHYSNLTSNNIIICEPILKKTVPQYNSNSLNCKKEHHSIAPLSLQLRSYKINIFGKIGLVCKHFY